MAENTNIEWCDHTFNPWIGCAKVSPACDHCYAENLMDTRMHKVIWGPKAERVRTSESNWKLPLKWNRRAEGHLRAWECFKAGYPGMSDADLIAKGFTKPRKPRVFCASLADVFDNAVPAEWRADLFALILKTPHLDWLLLTKRIGNVKPMLAELAHGSDPDLSLLDMMPLDNVWLGATICNQPEADRDIKKLRAIPAHKHFLSIEPLLGPVDLGLCNCDKGSRAGPDGAGGVTCSQCEGAGGQMLDWVIVGGESGADARPMSIRWVRELRDQCLEAGVPFLFKQWGEWAAAKHYPSATPGVFAYGDYEREPDRFIRTDHYPRAFTSFGARSIVECVGKKAAGRTLDGRTWDEYPSI